ncbi:MAG: hypothetical protein AMXMBFR57_30760 [Acidimicrobiia bacterium]
MLSTIALVAQAQRFASYTDAVAVPVLVTSGGRPVTNLTIDDFALTDSGVPQTISALQGVDAPLDVSLVVQQTMFFNFRERDTFAREIRDVQKLLRPTDRLEIVSTSYGGQVLMPLGPPDRQVVIPVEPIQPCVTVYDALVHVLARQPVAQRQQIAVLFTEDEGAGGAVSATMALRVARRGSVAVSVLHLTPRWIGGTVTVTWGAQPRCAWTRTAWGKDSRDALRAISVIPDVVQQQQAFLVAQRERLNDLAHATGGHRLKPSVFGRSLVGAIKPLLDEARSRYILYYAPTGRSEPGWHPLEVSLRRPGRFDISARPGYER